MAHPRWHTSDDTPQMANHRWHTSDGTPQMTHRRWHTSDGTPQMTHHRWHTSDGTPQMTPQMAHLRWHLRWHTSESLQQWLRERTSMLCYPYTPLYFSFLSLLLEFRILCLNKTGRLKSTMFNFKKHCDLTSILVVLLLGIYVTQRKALNPQYASSFSTAIL